MHLNNFLEMLDSQRIEYKKYKHKDTIEIAIPTQFGLISGYSCYEFDFDGKFESLWDRDYEYGYSQYDPELDDGI